MGGVINHLDISKFTLGTMRFVDKSLSNNEVLEIIENCFDSGITTHHSSFEYNSYELYCQSLSKFNRKKSLKHIVKLSSPHFEEKDFSEEILEKRVDNQLKALDIDTIDVLQWLVRSKPINDSSRINILLSQREEIEYCFQNLKKKGKINQVFSFPYSVPFANEVIKLNTIDGIISYLNKEEQDYVELANSRPFIAIRPLNAGKLIGKNNPKRDFEQSIAFVKSHSHVLSQVLSINNLKQVNSLKEVI